MGTDKDQYLSSTAIWRRQAEVRFTICSTNLSGAGLLGVERSRLNGRHFRQFLTEADRPALPPSSTRFFYARPKRRARRRSLTKEHSPRSVQIEAIATYSGKQCRLAVIDITQRMRAEKELRESGERYRLLVETMLRGVIMGVFNPQLDTYRWISVTRFRFLVKFCGVMTPKYT